MIRIYLIYIYIVVLSLFVPTSVRAQAIDEDKPMTPGVAVDIGLSVKWADRNIGADKPEQYGIYYAWGEIKPKNVYTWNTYRLSRGQDLYKKYSLEQEHCAKGFTCDHKHRLEAADDAATVNWGPTWRIPTASEIKELFIYCEWKEAKRKGTKGYEVTGPNGKSIFFPFAGYMFGADPQETGKTCVISCSDLMKSDHTASQTRTIGEGSFSNPASFRHVGVTIRAVTNK